MIKYIGIISAISVIAFSVFPLNASSSERLLEASITARSEYNDNIFLTASAHDSVSSVVVTPSLSGIIKEQNWQLDLNSRLRINRYSDSELNSTGQLFKLTGQYNAERNIFSLSIGHDLISSLRSTSSDFGISSQQVERKTQSVTPQFTRLLTERSILSLSYSYSDADYDDDADSRFVASYTETATVALRYNLSETDQVSINLQGVDYTRKDNLGDIQLFNINLRLDHQFSENLSVDLSVGGSRRNSTNLQTSVLDFFGTSILVSQEIDNKTNGKTLDFGFNQLLESGEFGVRVNRDTTTNSFGGLDEIDTFVINYNERLSSLWRYDLVARYNNTNSISVATTSTDREVISLEARTSYSITRDWNMSLSYRYSQRKFTSISSTGNTPDSNRLQIGLTYNLPRLSTF